MGSGLISQHCPSDFTDEGTGKLQIFSVAPGPRSRVDCSSKVCLFCRGPRILPHPRGGVITWRSLCLRLETFLGTLKTLGLRWWFSSSQCGLGFIRLTAADAFPWLTRTRLLTLLAFTVPETTPSPFLIIRVLLFYFILYHSILLAIHYVALADLKLPIWSSKPSNFQTSSCFCLPSAEITCVDQHSGWFFLGSLNLYIRTQLSKPAGISLPLIALLMWEIHFIIVFLLLSS